MNLSLWYGFWGGVSCGLWLAAGIAILKLRQEAKRLTGNPWATRIPGDRASSLSVRMGLPAMMLAAGPRTQHGHIHALDQTTDIYSAASKISARPKQHWSNTDA